MSSPPWPANVTQVWERMSMKPRLVVFDVAGTTVRDDGDVVTEALLQAFARFRLKVQREHIREHMGLAKQQAIRLILRDSLEPSTLLHPRLLEAVHQDFLETMCLYYAEHAEAIDGAEDTFSWLRAQGVALVVDTGFPRRVLDAILSRLSWQDRGLISAAIASDEVEFARPSPEMLRRAMRLSSVADSAWVTKVGDTPADLCEGLNGECGQNIGVLWGSHDRASLERFPHTHLVEDWEELRAVLEGQSTSCFGLGAAASTSGRATVIEEREPARR